MSFLLRTRRAPAMLLRTHAFSVQRAAFGTSMSRMVGKESSLNHEGRAEEAEAHKNDQLQKQKEGKGHWVDELASDSESAIKADRHEHGHDGEPDFESLQNATKDMPSKKG